MTQESSADATRRAIVDAASALMSQRGPAAVSIRDVAERAELPRGRVHDLFPSKHELLAAVLQDKADAVARELAPTDLPGANLGGLFGAAQFLFESAAQADFWRILARSVLDQADSHRLQVGFPAIEVLIARVEALQEQGLFDPDLDPRVLVGGWVSASLGWLLFGDHLAMALGYGPEGADQARREILSQTLANLAYAAGPRR